MDYKQICLSGKCVARYMMFSCSQSTTRSAVLLLPQLCGKFRENQNTDREEDIQDSSVALVSLVYLHECDPNIQDATEFEFMFSFL